MSTFFNISDKLKLVEGNPFFIISVKSDNTGTSNDNQFTIPTDAGTYLYNVTSDDGYSATGLTGAHTITFPTGAGTHIVTISGSFPEIGFNNSGDKLKILSVNNFGNYGIGSTSQTSAFAGAANLVINATDVGNFGNVDSLYQAFNSCSSLTSFPLIDTSSATNFIQTWQGCTSLTSFPAIDTSAATIFVQTWIGCSALTTFPGNVFDNCTATNFGAAFNGTNLTTQSIDNILVSLDTAGQSNGSFGQSGGQAPSSTGLSAITSLQGKGWTITYTT